MHIEVPVPLLQEGFYSAFTAPPALKQKLIEVAHLYAEAEAVLKQVERTASELPVPLINELRYAGSHLSRYLLEKNTDKIDEEIQKAKNHCERAIFDAYEIMLIWYLDNFKRFSEQYAGVSLVDTIPDYHSSRKAIREVRDFVERFTRKDERIVYCRNAKGLLERLKPIWESYDDAREEIVKKARKERRSFLLTFFSVLVGVAGFIIALCKSLSISG